MKEAYGQALGYARSFDRPEPFIIVCDIGHCFDLYATFDGTSNYRPFPNAQASRIFLRDLAEHADTLRRVFEEPLDLDPSRHSMKVTREVAAHLAALAKKLEDDGNNQELVAQFLMRCLFTLFAEDVGLLPEGIFTKALKEQWLPHPAAFPGGVASLWRTMNEGGEVFGVVGKILRFNGGLFASPKALALDKKAWRSCSRRQSATGPTSSPPSSAPCLSVPSIQRSATPSARISPHALTSSAWSGRPSRSRCEPTGTWCKPTSAR